ncbi:hypothetical protein AB0F91_06170 [Amycolatopsis sp. NPDC023774]|uniref:hypothetical protein n=1 Tax=Amycolatopsis sp. NPDC023774 TaxID=3155015 RepID=UPI0033D0DABC
MRASGYGIGFTLALIVPRLYSFMLVGLGKVVGYEYGVVVPGEMLNTVAVFRSPVLRAGEEDRGTPDDLDTAFAATCEPARAGLPHLWRDRWWRMYDREPIGIWVDGRLALRGDAARPMLQYLGRGACQALETPPFSSSKPRSTTPVPAQTGTRPCGTFPRPGAVRPARVQRTVRDWGDPRHGLFHATRNALQRDRAVDAQPGSWTGSTDAARKEFRSAPAWRTRHELHRELERIFCGPTTTIAFLIGGDRRDKCPGRERCAAWQRYLDWPVPVGDTTWNE